MRRLLAVAALALVSACSVGGLLEGAEPGPTVDVRTLPPLRVATLNITVPDTLTVSEADSYKPSADIVWREEGFGDRYAQVEAIFRDGMGRGVKAIRGNLPVTVDVTVLEFHALTERTRYSVGGIHAIKFSLQVSNAKTGDILIPTYIVRANLRAYGGSEAIIAERQGLTQKVRIVGHLSSVIQSQLTGLGYSPPP